MALYRYRVILMLGLIVVILLLSYLLDLRAIKDDQMDMLRQEQALQETLQRIASQAVKAGPLSSGAKPPSSINDFLQIIHESDVDLVSIINATEDNVDNPIGESYHLVLAGDYLPIVQVMQSLSQQSDRYLLRRFLISPGDKRPLQIELLMSLHSSASLRIVPPLLSRPRLRNPFCYASDAALMRVPVNAHTKQFALNEIRLLGVVRHDAERVAVILFPDGLVEERLLGGVMGKEGGIVTLIAADQVKVQLPGQRQFILHRAAS